MPGVASPPTVLHELDGPDTCDMCGTPGLKTELVRDPFIYGAGDDGVELVVDIPVQTCSSCGPYTDDQAEDIRHDEVCRHLGVLTATEIRDLRAKYELSRAELARITGLGESSIARWETREIIQNVGNDRYLRLLQDPAIFRWAKSLASREPVHAEPSELSPGLASQLRDSGAHFTLVAGNVPVSRSHVTAKILWRSYSP